MSDHADVPTTFELPRKKRGRRGGRGRNRRGKTERKIHEESHRRQRAWSEGDQALVVRRATSELDHLFGRLRGERAVGDAASSESPVTTAGAPRLKRGEVITARSRKHEGEVQPVFLARARRAPR